MQRGKVKSDTGLNLRLKPNGDRIGVLKFKEEFSIVDEITFYRVKTDSGQVGYVHGDYVEKIPKPTMVPKTETTRYSMEFRPVIYTGEAFVGETVKVDQDFVPDLQRVSAYAAECHLKIWVTSSLRSLDNQINGAIVKPATHSCHHVGHAIDMNIFHKDELYNSKRLRKTNHSRLPEEVVRFIEEIRSDPVLRWGGDFSRQDPVHIDNNFFNREKIIYLAKIDDRIMQSNA
jgi:hypothetical protein